MLEACAVHSLMDPTRQVAMLSVGGPGTGTTWSAMPAGLEDAIDDVHFVTMTGLRFLTLQVPAGTRCAMPKSDHKQDGEQCGLCVDTLGLHFHNCGAGAARLRPHRAFLVRLASQLRKAGAHTDLERHCPNLYGLNTDGSVREAILDIVSVWPGCPVAHAIDVTIRSAFSSHRYADSIPGCAAAAGERSKYSRYGHSVYPISIETLGRMGQKSQDSLRALLSVASIWGKYALYRVWRRFIEFAVLWELADAVLVALGGPQAWWRSLAR